MQPQSVRRCSIRNLAAQMSRLESAHRTRSVKVLSGRKSSTRQERAWRAPLFTRSLRNDEGGPADALRHSGRARRASWARATPLPEPRERAATPRQLCHAHALGASRPRLPPAGARRGRVMHAKKHQRAQVGRATRSFPPPTYLTPRAKRLVERCQTRPTPDAHAGQLLALIRAS